MRHFPTCSFARACQIYLRMDADPHTPSPTHPLDNAPPLSQQERPLHLFLQEAEFRLRRPPRPHKWWVPPFPPRFCVFLLRPSNQVVSIDQLYAPHWSRGDCWVWFFGRRPFSGYRPSQRLLIQRASCKALSQKPCELRCCADLSEELSRSGTLFVRAKPGSMDLEVVGSSWDDAMSLVRPRRRLREPCLERLYGRSFPPAWRPYRNIGSFFFVWPMPLCRQARLALRTCVLVLSRGYPRPGLTACSG